MHKILLQIVLQKAQAYSVQYGEHFCKARCDKALQYKRCETPDSYRFSNEVTIACAEHHDPTAEFRFNNPELPSDHNDCIVAVSGTIRHLASVSIN